jgi:hypothetical protein
MKTYTFSSHKGGVGTTTVACSVACLLAGEGHETLLVDAGHNPDTYSWLGWPTPVEMTEPVEVSANLWVVRAESAQDVVALNLSPYSYIVTDAGQRPMSLSFSDTDEKVLVARNDYMALSNAVKHDMGQYHKAVVIMENERVLNDKDCRNVLRVETLIVEWLPALSRAIDAGLAPSRVSGILGDALAQLLPPKITV